MRKEVEISLMELLFAEVGNKDDAIFIKVKEVPVIGDGAANSDGYKYVNIYYGFASDFAKYLFHLLNEKGCFCRTFNNPLAGCSNIKDYDKLCSLKLRINLETEYQGLKLGKDVYVFRVPAITCWAKCSKVEMVADSIATLLVDMVKQLLAGNDKDYSWVVTQQKEFKKDEKDITGLIEGNTLALYIWK